MSPALLLLLLAQAEPDDPNDTAGYTPSDGGGSLLWTGYVDIGFAHATGDGTSFHPDDTRLPADYVVDPFATAVNSRGEVASTDTGGRLTNGFLPRSVGIGGRPSFLVNTIDFDLRYTPARAPLLIFARFQLLPRFTDSGDETRVVAEQAFARIVPFDSTELSVSVGKFDSVFGIEYLENQANLRTGVTPSLIARYTTGPSVGAKGFYRVQIPRLWSALSLHGAFTNSGTMTESLQGPDRSLTGVPVASGRFGYDLNLPHVQLRLGASGVYGPRNDQRDPDAVQAGFGVDARVFAFGVALDGEFLHLHEDPGGSTKVSGAGPYPVASGFRVNGFWTRASYGLDVPLRSLRRITAYGRFERRWARFAGFAKVEVERITAGLRLDLWDSVALKGEALWNRERSGAPTVDNDVYTSSLVFSW